MKKPLKNLSNRGIILTGLSQNPGWHRSIGLKTLALTCKQFSIILKSGLPLGQAVELIADQTADKDMRDLLHQVSEDIAGGWSLSYSFSQRGGKRLPAAFAETLAAGEESGDLAGAFGRLSAYFDRMDKTRSKVTSAMIYPAFVLVAAVVVVGIIMIYAVPTFADTFASMNVQLPWATRILISISAFLRRYLLGLIAVIAAAILAIRLYSHTEKGGETLGRLKLRLPLLGVIAQMAGASQFAHTMVTMLSAGMPVLRALDVSARVISNQSMAGAISRSVAGVEEGHTLGAAMAQRGELPQMLVQMIAVGESAGNLEDTLEILAEYYDHEVDIRTSRAIALLEPIMICLLAVIVVVILLAVYLPMFQLEGAI